jgi:hypothetical protein
VGEADRDVENEPGGDHADVDREHRAHRDQFDSGVKNPPLTNRGLSG